MRKLKNSELNRITIEEFKSIKKLPVVIILDNVRSLNNIGSVFRTADAFLVKSIYLCGITATPPHKDIHKTALGATDSVDWKYFKTVNKAVSELREKKYKIISIEQTTGSERLEEFKIFTDNKYALIFGHEVKGVNQEIVDISDASIEIPQFGTKHSINVSVSVGIVMWNFFTKMKIQ